jgi:hypothetical protein
MDQMTYNRTKAILLQDYRSSGKDLGTFALEWMDVYDDMCYELRLLEATSKGKRVTGTAFLGSCEAVEEFIQNYEISGTYTIDVIDTQKEFFNILQEIKSDLELQAHPNSSFNNALREMQWGVSEI